MKEICKTWFAFYSQRNASKEHSDDTEEQTSRYGQQQPSLQNYKQDGGETIRMWITDMNNNKNHIINNMPGISP